MLSSSKLENGNSDPNPAFPTQLDSSESHFGGALGENLGRRHQGVDIFYHTSHIVITHISIFFTMSILARQTVRSARTALRQQQPLLRRNLHVENTHETVSFSNPNLPRPSGQKRWLSLHQCDTLLRAAIDWCRLVEDCRIALQRIAVQVVASLLT